jgi:hypothetical protein
VEAARVSNIRGVELVDGAQLDAFNRLRTSHPATVMAYQNRYDESDLLWEDDLTGSGTATHLPNESSMRLRVTTSGDKVIRQTRHYHPYQPGKSQRILLTSVPGAAETNVRRRFGLFDANNGLFFEETAGTKYVVRRTYTSGSPVDNTVAQASWNLDTLDGSGPSGVTLDWSKSQIALIDYQWLGVGRVRMGFEIDGKPYYCHEFKNTNSLATVYMTTGSLPLRYEIEATGVPGATSDLIAVCGSVDSEGGLDFGRGYPFSVSNGTATRSVSAQTCILSIQPKATFNSITNRILIIPETFSVYTDGAGVWELIYGHTIGGSPSYASANADSGVEYDVAGTTVTGGIVIASGYITSAVGGAANQLSEQVASILPLTLDISGANPKNLSVVYTPLTGSDAAAASISWREVR